MFGSGGSWWFLCHTFRNKSWGSVISMKFFRKVLYRYWSTCRRKHRLLEVKSPRIPFSLTADLSHTTSCISSRRHPMTNLEAPPLTTTFPTNPKAAAGGPPATAEPHKHLHVSGRNRDQGLRGNGDVTLITRQNKTRSFRASLWPLTFLLMTWAVQTGSGFVRFIFR